MRWYGSRSSSFSYDTPFHIKVSISNCEMSFSGPAFFVLPFSSILSQWPFESTRKPQNRHKMLEGKKTSCLTRTRAEAEKETQYVGIPLLGNQRVCKRHRPSGFALLLSRPWVEKKGGEDNEQWIDRQKQICGDQKKRVGLSEKVGTTF